jgi:hypothetical protein
LSVEPFNLTYKDTPDGLTIFHYHRRQALFNNLLCLNCLDPKFQCPLRSNIAFYPVNTLTPHSFKSLNINTKNSKAVFILMPPDTLKVHCFFWKVPRLSSVVLPRGAACQGRCVRSIGGMIQARENRSTRRKTWHSTTLSTANLIQTDLGSNPCLLDERPATSCLRHDMDFSSYLTENIM